MRVPHYLTRRYKLLIQFLRSLPFKLNFKRLKSNSLRAKKNMFGVSLLKNAQNYGQPLPLPMQRALQYLRRNAMTQQDRARQHFPILSDSYITSIWCLFHDSFGRAERVTMTSLSFHFTSLSSTSERDFSENQESKLEFKSFDRRWKQIPKTSNSNSTISRRTISQT